MIDMIGGMSKKKKTKAIKVVKAEIIDSSF